MLCPLNVCPHLVLLANWDSGPSPRSPSTEAHLGQMYPTVEPVSSVPLASAIQNVVKRPFRVRVGVGQLSLQLL
jgi:hypothetical protein